MWLEVLVLMDRKPQKVCDLDGRGQPQSYLHISEPLELCRSWGNGRLQPITFSAARMICCSMLLSLAVAAAYQMVMEEVRMDSMMAV